MRYTLEAMSLTDRILRRLKRAEPDRVFTRSDLLDLGSTDAIGMALQRMVKAGKLRRIGRGLYDIPRKHPLLGELSASSDAIAAAIARRDDIRLQPTEAAAANLLNLSEQVPARMVYHTDRRRRTVKVGQRTIEFRERSRRKMAAAGRAGGLVMAALHSLGRQHVTPEHLAHLRKLLKPSDRRRLLKDLRFAPAWMHPHMRFIAGEKKKP
jgi:predicted transcriptional regulator of viral defense system